MNSISLFGNITSDIETRNLQDGTILCNLSIAVRRDAEKTDYFNCVAWRKTAEIVQKYCRKGDQIGITGTIQQERWTTDSGEKRSAYKVHINRVDLVRKPKEQDSNTPADNKDVDMPF